MLDFFVTQPNKIQAAISGGLLTRKPEFGERYRHSLFHFGFRSLIGLTNCDFLGLFVPVEFHQKSGL
jgi:hypothetical protein